MVLSLAMLAVPMTLAFVPTTARTLRRSTAQPLPSSFVARHPPRYRISTVAAANKNNDSDDGDDDTANTFLNKPLLAADLFGILIACELLGLLDVVNDPAFAANGGFFQPIPVVPTTLDTLVQRISVLACCWLIPSSGRSQDRPFWQACLAFVAVRCVVAFVYDQDDVATLAQECYVVTLTQWTARYDTGSCMDEGWGAMDGDGTAIG
eukprot:CAMPEP_0198118880 /NCGR_PEP_ID=MMETSP1442-20131203/23416_1 /TAXON_ID= /ORGANISM="Craspedostauros australis, Strain CCMP3328" /LENGTH=207 /DNA_ID=CAMNT_0043777223 /DNA_START=10 /DNA_END=634 /DNA_ORIENTATION=+